MPRIHNALDSFSALNLMLMEKPPFSLGRLALLLPMLTAFLIVCAIADFTGIKIGPAVRALPGVCHCSPPVGGDGCADILQGVIDFTQGLRDLGDIQDCAMLLPQRGILEPCAIRPASHRIPVDDGQGTDFGFHRVDSSCFDEWRDSCCNIYLWKH